MDFGSGKGHAEQHRQTQHLEGAPSPHKNIGTATCSFFSISFPAPQIFAEPQGAEQDGASGRMESPSLLRFSSKLKGRRCFKKTRAFHKLLNAWTSPACSPCLPGPELLLPAAEVGWLTGSTAALGSPSASRAAFTRVQTDTQPASVRAERNLYSHIPDLCPKRLETQERAIW